MGTIFSLTTLSSLLPLLRSIIPKALLLFCVWIGRVWGTRMIQKYIPTLLNQSSLSKTLRVFFISATVTARKIGLILILVSGFGIETTSFAAVFGAATLAIGMALNGSLSHVAAGCMILLYEPFAVDDMITVKGHTGRVQDISLFYTTLITEENTYIVIPNGLLTNDSIIHHAQQNFSKKK